jgi:hypothetical protein
MSKERRDLYNEIALELIEHMKHIPDAEHIIRGYFQARMDKEVQAEQARRREQMGGFQYKAHFNADPFAGIDDELFEKVFGGGRSGRSSFYQQQQTKTPKNPFADLFEEAHRKSTGTEYPKAKKKTVDPKVRRAEIERELDIIRGVSPTPKGYKVDPRKAKALMIELKELEGK